MASDMEVPLVGGMSTPGVVRVGETVRRPMGANAEYVHDVFLHLELAPPHNGFELTEQAVRAGARLVRDVMT